MARELQKPAQVGDRQISPHIDRRSIVKPKAHNGQPVTHQGDHSQVVAWRAKGKLLAPAWADLAGEFADRPARIVGLGDRLLLEFDLRAGPFPRRRLARGLPFAGIPFQCGAE